MSGNLKPNLNDDVSHMKDLVHGIGTAMLTTCDEHGAIHSRPMMPQEIDENGDLWFFTATDTAKVSEIHENSKVNVNFALNEQNKFVSICGVGRIIKDPKKIQELWKPQNEKWFPKGMKDSHLALLKIEVESCEYWEGNHSIKQTMVELAKSLIHGKHLDLSKASQDATSENHGKLDFAG